jgi:hypothetical protein
MSAVVSSVEYARERRRREQEALQARTAARIARQQAYRREKEAKVQEQSYRIILRYEAYFLPMLEEWLGTQYRLNPLSNPSDAFALLQHLAQRQIGYLQEEAHGFYKVMLTAQIPSSWKTGTGEGDTLAEALVFALWELIEE